MDAGSALVASVPGTLAFVFAVAFLRAQGHSDLDVMTTIGRRLAHDPYAAVGAGLIALLALGAVEAVLLAAVWGAIWTLWGPEAWPIAPLQGALMGLAQSTLWLALARTRRRWLPLFLGTMAFGAAMGAFYSPGI